jgi:hypothetical protein
MHIMLKMVSFGAHIHKINYMVFQYCKTIIYSSMKLVNVASYSTRKKQNRSLRGHLMSQSSLKTERKVLRDFCMH